MFKPLYEDGSVLQDTGAVTATMGCCQTKLAKGANGKVSSVHCKGQSLTWAIPCRGNRRSNRKP